MVRWPLPSFGLLLGLLTGCSSTDGTPDRNFGGFDGGTTDTGTNPPDSGRPLEAGPLPCVPACGPTEICEAGRCVSGLDDADMDGIAAALDCNDKDFRVGAMGERPCESACGPGVETCSNGVWGDCSAPTECDCTDPSATRMLPCEQCGMQLQLCDNGQWRNEGGCANQGECAPGTTEMGADCTCGREQRVCTPQCTFADWMCVGACTCGDGACNGGETCNTCDQDCGPCAPMCGDGTCNGSETCSTCNQDCGPCAPMCGDGTCNGSENCSTCEQDCGMCPASCGDMSCNNGETCSTCPQDCGPCAPMCGDGTCNGSETCSSCQQDCGPCAPMCGDGTCNGSETCSTCEQDCGPCTPMCGDGTCNGSETCASCADCQAGHMGMGNNGDPCLAMYENQWRCVTITSFGVPGSQVCRMGSWVTFNLNPSDCNACVCSYSAACAQ